MLQTISKWVVYSCFTHIRGNFIDISWEIYRMSCGPIYWDLIQWNFILIWNFVWSFFVGLMGFFHGTLIELNWTSI